MTDDLHFCPRCNKEVTPLGRMCSNCRQEVMRNIHSTLGWRDEYEHKQEEDEELRTEVERDPKYVEKALAAYDRLIDRAGSKDMIARWN